MKKCSYCGRESEDAAVACRECGKEFGAEAAPEVELTDPALSPVIVATQDSLQEAQLLVDRLAAAGIEAFIPEEYSTQVFSAVVPLEPLTVRVAARDAEAARAILAEPIKPSSTDAPQDIQAQ